MDQAALVGLDPDIRAGSQLLEVLDKAEFPVLAAFWIFEPEARTWRLTFATPLVDSQGPRKAYERLFRLAHQHGVRLPKRDISLVTPKDPLVHALRRATKTDDLIHGTRLSQSSVFGIYVEDAIIYRT